MGEPSGMGGALWQHVAALRDPRVARARVHALLAIITIALCGVICGAESWVEIAELGRAKAAWFTTFLDLPSGIPAQDPFGRVFARLDAAQFEAACAAWRQAVAARLPLPPLEEGAVQAVVARDGKTLRRSHDRGAGKLALHLVRAWASANRLILTQLAVAEKSNEITAFPAVLRQVDLAGCLVTSDAMGCQTAVAAQVLDQQADYVLALTENQGNRYEEVVASFAWARASGFAEFPAGRWSYWRQVGQGHGRLEVHDHWVLADPAVLVYLTERVTAWPGLRAIGLVVAPRTFPDGQTTQ